MPTTTISGTIDSGTVCFDRNVSPTASHGSFTATVTGGTGKWAGASGSFSVVADGEVLSFDSATGTSQQNFTATLTGTIQHP